jgi:hypothetical protein
MMKKFPLRICDYKACKHLSRLSEESSPQIEEQKLQPQRARREQLLREISFLMNTPTVGELDTPVSLVIVRFS